MQIIKKIIGLLVVLLLLGVFAYDLASAWQESQFQAQLSRLQAEIDGINTNASATIAYLETGMYLNIFPTVQQLQAIEAQKASSTKK